MMEMKKVSRKRKTASKLRRIYVVPLGSDYSKSLIDEWKLKFENTFELVSAFNLEQVETVVASKRITKKELEDHLNCKFSDLPLVLSLDWIRGLTEGNEDAYKWSSEIPLPVKEETIMKGACLNQALVNEMDWFSKYYKFVENRGVNQFKSFRYRIARDLFQDLLYLVTVENLDEIQRVCFGVGPSIKAKAKEVLVQGKSSKRKQLEMRPETNPMLDLTRIDGVGYATAKKLIQNGFTSVQALQEEIRKEVKKNTNSDKSAIEEQIPKKLLSRSSIVSLSYFDDLQEMIPRVEAEMIGVYVRKIAHEMFTDKFLVEIAGSFRRGKVSTQCLYFRTKL